MDSSRITIKKIKNKASIRFLAANGIFRLSVRLSHFFDYVPIIVSSWKF